MMWKLLKLWFLCFIPIQALANNLQGFAISTILTRLIDLLNHELTRLCFVLALIAVGYGWLYLGRIPKEKAIGAIIGVGLIASSSYIAKWLGVA